MTPSWLTGFGDASAAVRATAVLLGLGQAVTTLEYVAVRDAFGDRGIYAWPALRLGRPARPPAWTRLRDTVFGRSGTLVLFGVRLVLSLALAVLGATGAWPALAGAAAVALAVVLVAENVRIPWGREGADDLAVHVALGLAVVALCDAAGAPPVGLVYIAAMAALAYVTAGVTKVVEPLWRSGEALAWVVNLQSFGAPWAYDLLEPRPRLRWFLCWLTMVAEMATPLAVLLPAPGFVAVLALGFAFHVANAVVMGLNSFVWTFAATYPSAAFVWAQLHT
ncbi:MAG: hypothetical protein MUF83_18170 [Acidimicrobiales bacterium]|nr:hypothetical protein [Acidimicrobiales bacterium]